MVGLIQKLLMDLVEESAGADAVAEVKRRADVPADRVFRMDEVYDDEEWRRKGLLPALLAAIAVAGTARFLALGDATQSDHGYSPNQGYSNLITRRMHDTSSGKT